METDSNVKLSAQEREWAELERQLREHPPQLDGSCYDAADISGQQLRWYARILHSRAVKRQYVSYATLSMLRNSFLILLYFLTIFGVSALFKGWTEFFSIAPIVLVLGTLVFTALGFIVMLFKGFFKWGTTREHMEKICEAMPRTWVGKAAACYYFTDSSPALVSSMVCGDDSDIDSDFDFDCDD